MTKCEPFAQGMQRLCGMYCIYNDTHVGLCRSVDAVAKEPGDGMPTTDFEALFAGLSGNCKY